AGMVLDAADRDLHPALPCYRGDHAERVPLALEDGALLDVGLHEPRDVVALGLADPGRVEPQRSHRCADGHALSVGDPLRLVWSDPTDDCPGAPEGAGEPAPF